MAMIIGGFSRNGDFELKPIPFLPEVKIRRKKYAVYAAGKSLIHFSNTKNEHYVICGSAIDSNQKLMNESDWQVFFDQKKEISTLNGHFLIMKILNDEIQIFNDQLGLRKLFIYDTGNEIYFSTRLDWISKLIKKPQFNLNYLWSLWNLENPVEKACLIEGVQVLGELAEAVISASGISAKSSPWLPKKQMSKIEDGISFIEKIIHSVLESTGNVSLGLSGGVDSRTLLALFLSQDRSLWSTHTFGQKTHYDIHIANAIAKTKKLDHIHHDISPYQYDEFFGTWQDFVLETNCLLPAYAYHELSYYKILPQETFFIDGGKGEFIRRGLSNRLSVLGKKALLDNNVENVKQYLLAAKPDLFSAEIKQKMASSLNQQVAALIDELPPVVEFGVENWVDLYNIRCRTSNSGYVGQTRLDCIINNLMPFIQPEVLNIVFNIPPKHRRNEMLNRKILNRDFSLKLFPFARYKTAIPYQHNKYTCLLWGKFMRMIIKEKDDNIRQFALLNREYSLSRLSDIDFLNSSVYDIKKIKKLVQGFYEGTHNDPSFVIWWMTFDVWHQLLFVKYSET